MRKWADANTAILYAYSQTDEEQGAVLFTMKFDAEGNWKIVNTHRAVEKGAPKGATRGAMRSFFILLVIVACTISCSFSVLAADDKPAPAESPFNELSSAAGNRCFHGAALPKSPANKKS